MDAGSISRSELRFLANARRAVLATRRPDGGARLVPVCFALSDRDEGAGARLYSPIDEKPKLSEDPLRLARIHDIEAHPGVTLLVDRWDEDWTKLAWLMVDAQASLVWPGGVDGAEHATAVALLRAKYLQYADHDLERRPILRFVIGRTRSWGTIED